MNKLNALIGSLRESRVSDLFKDSDGDDGANSFTRIMSSISRLPGWRHEGRGTLIGDGRGKTIDPKVVKVLRGEGFGKPVKRKLGVSTLWTFSGSGERWAQYTIAPQSVSHSLYLTRRKSEIY
jgi:hypothetical protein